MLARVGGIRNVADKEDVVIGKRRRGLIGQTCDVEHEVRRAGGLAAAQAASCGRSYRRNVARASAGWKRKSVGDYVLQSSRPPQRKSYVSAREPQCCGRDVIVRVRRA